MTSISFALSPKPPFRLDLTAWVLRRRSHNLVDRWDGRTYQRVLVIQEEPVLVAATQTGTADSPGLEIGIRGKNLEAIGAVPVIKTLLTRMLGLDADLTEFYRMAGQNARLEELVNPWRGVKPPCFPGVFEALVNAIACQQISLTVGIHLLNRLATAYGPAFQEAAESIAAFPRPSDLAGADLEDLRRLGLSRSKGRYLIELAQRVTQGRINLEELDNLDDGEVVSYLEALPGIGRWSAEYALLRGLGRWRVFPGDDVGARKRLQTWLGLSEPLNYEEVRNLLSGWQPFGGLIYFHLLLSHLAEEGALAA